MVSMTMAFNIHLDLIHRQNMVMMVQQLYSNVNRFLLGLVEFELHILLKNAQELVIDEQTISGLTVGMDPQPELAVHFGTVLGTGDGNPRFRRANIATTAVLTTIVAGQRSRTAQLLSNFPVILVDKVELGRLNSLDHFNSGILESSLLIGFTDGDESIKRITTLTGMSVNN